MYRIRFHGRGGQGIKMASRILGTALFRSGFTVQDAPKYGAERRGAPIFAYVRASQQAINERGIIQHPDLVIVADDTLVAVPAAAVLQGISNRTIVLINSHQPPEVWQDRLNIKATILTLPAGKDIQDRAELPFIGATCAGAAAAVLGIIGRNKLRQSIEEELASLSPTIVQKNCDNALQAFDALAKHSSLVTEGQPLSAIDFAPPEWTHLPFEEARISAPNIYAPDTSVEVRTGLWRTMRPIIDYDRCNKCWWVCSTFCPDSAINVQDGIPVIDYDHCKGCLVCVGVCPPHAIEATPEHLAQQQEKEEPTTGNTDDS